MTKITSPTSWEMYRHTEDSWDKTSFLRNDIFFRTAQSSRVVLPSKDEIAGIPIVHLQRMYKGLDKMHEPGFFYAPLMGVLFDNMRQEHSLQSKYPLAGRLLSETDRINCLHQVIYGPEDFDEAKQTDSLFTTFALMYPMTVLFGKYLKKDKAEGVPKALQRSQRKSLSRVQIKRLYSANLDRLFGTNFFIVLRSGGPLAKDETEDTLSKRQEIRSLIKQTLYTNALLKWAEAPNIRENDSESFDEWSQFMNTFDWLCAQHEINLAESTGYYVSQIGKQHGPPFVSDKEIFPMRLDLSKLS